MQSQVMTSDEIIRLDFSSNSNYSSFDTGAEVEPTSWGKTWEEIFPDADESIQKHGVPTEFEPHFVSDKGLEFWGCTFPYQAGDSAFLELHKGELYRFLALGSPPSLNVMKWIEDGYRRRNGCSSADACPRCFYCFIVVVLLAAISLLAAGISCIVMIDASNFSDVTPINSTCSSTSLSGSIWMVVVGFAFICFLVIKLFGSYILCMFSRSHRFYRDVDTQWRKLSANNKRTLKEPYYVAFYSASLPWSKREAELFGDVAVEASELHDENYSFPVVEDREIVLWIACHDEEAIAIFEKITAPYSYRVIAILLNSCYSNATKKNLKSVVIPIITFDVNSRVSDFQAFQGSLKLLACFYHLKDCVGIERKIYGAARKFISLVHDFRSSDDQRNSRSPLDEATLSIGVMDVFNEKRSCFMFLGGTYAELFRRQAEEMRLAQFIIPHDVLLERRESCYERLRRSKVAIEFYSDAKYLYIFEAFAELVLAGKITTQNYALLFENFDSFSMREKIVKKTFVLEVCTQLRDLRTLLFQLKHQRALRITCVCEIEVTPPRFKLHWDYVVSFPGPDLLCFADGLDGGGRGEDGSQKEVIREYLKMLFNKDRSLGGDDYEERNQYDYGMDYRHLIQRGQVI